MATVVLSSKISIEGFKPFAGVNAVTIKKSLGSYLDTAIIKIPATARMKQAGAEEIRSVQTARQFKRGQKITVALGYDGSLKTEFEGFISRVNMRTHCELECEGYAFQLRSKNINKVWKNTTIKQVVQDIISGTDIVLGDVDDGPMSVFAVYNKNGVGQNGLEALKILKKALGETENIWFDGNRINAAIKYYSFTDKNKEGKADAVYKIGWNTIDDKDMKQRELGDTKVEVNLTHVQKNGDRITAKAGIPNSNFQQKQLQAIVDKAQLQKRAKAKEAVENYSGFNGKLVGFLVPQVKPGNKLKVIDLKYPERSGNYLVESVETKFGTSGARRTVDISFKL